MGKMGYQAFRVIDLLGVIKELKLISRRISMRYLGVRAISSQSATNFNGWINRHLTVYVVLIDQACVPV